MAPSPDALALPPGHYQYPFAPKTMVNYQVLSESHPHVATDEDGSLSKKCYYRYLPFTSSQCSSAFCMDSLTSHNNPTKMVKRSG